MGNERDIDERPESPAHELAARLRARSPEIEAGILTKIEEVYEVPPEAHTELIASARVVIREAVAYSISAFDAGDEWAEPVPSWFVAQARHAARIEMPLDEFLRSFSAGNSVISEVVAEEVEGLSRPYTLLAGVAVQSRVSAALINGLTAAYEEEKERSVTSPLQRLVLRVERLLAGDSLAGEEIDYNLEAWHIGAIVLGEDRERASRRMAEVLGCELLLVPRAADVHWVWWGGADEIPFSRLEKGARAIGGVAFVAVGDARPGIRGFRTSHREAEVAAAVTVRSSERLTRCADVMLAGVFLREPALADLYLETYLGPLRARRDWQGLRETLAAYFNANGNLASAAAALGVDRHTVRRRLRRVEEAIDCPLDDRRAEFEVALRIDRFLRSA